MTIESDIALIQRLADEAADVVKPFFRKQIAVEDKADHSPVTAADRAVEAAIRGMLEKERPDDGLFGEEYGARSGRSERLWVIDPIDGTRGFIAGRPLFGTLIALVEQGRPVLGVISAPMAGDRWLGCTVGQPRATLNGQPIRVRPCPSLGEARAATTHPYAFTREGRERFDRVSLAAADTLYGGDCHNYGLLAAGFLDLVMEEGLNPYDWAALVPVIEGAGGRITDWADRPLSMAGKGRVLASGDRRIHEEALRLI